MGAVGAALLLSTALSFFQMRSTIRDQNRNNLNQVLALEKQAFEAYIQRLKDITQALAIDDTVQTTLAPIALAFDNLNAEVDSSTLENLIQIRLIGPLFQRGFANYSVIDPSGLLPHSLQGRALQQRYIASAGLPVDELSRWPGPESSSYDDFYSILHGELYPRLSIFGLYDIFLVSPSGDIVFSVAKEFDLGTNLFTGAFADSGLGQVVRELRYLTTNNKDLETPSTALRSMIQFSTVAPYPPSLGAPSLFTGSPIYRNGTLQGYLCTQVDFSAFQKTLNNNYNWEAMGLGSTGDILLVDADSRRLSIPRYLHDNPQLALQQLEQANQIPAQQLNQLRLSQASDARLPSTVLLTESGDAVGAALAGQSGYGRRSTLFGRDVMASWIPITNPSQPDSSSGWALIAQQELHEINAPLRRLLQRALLNSALALLATAMLGLWLSRRLMRPLQQLQHLTHTVVNQGLDSDVLETIPDQMHAVAASNNNEVGLLATDLAEQLSTTLDVLGSTRATIDSLASPISTLTDGVLFLPLIGHIDTLRAQQIKESALDRISQHRAHHFVLDLAGLVNVEGGMVPFLSTLCQAAQLLGCRTILSGVYPNLASKLTADGLTLGSTQSTASLSDALQLVQNSDQ